MASPIPSPAEASLEAITIALKPHISSSYLDRLVFLCRKVPNFNPLYNDTLFGVSFWDILVVKETENRAVLDAVSDFYWRRFVHNDNTKARGMELTPLAKRQIWDRMAQIQNDYTSFRTSGFPPLSDEIKKALEYVETARTLFVPILTNPSDLRTRFFVAEITKKLDVSKLGLTELPPLPLNLKELYCSDNLLTSLPNPLPQTLELLGCTRNRLTELPPLPRGLKTLSCISNRLTSLPPLPSGLVHLHCSDNRLRELPELPALVWHSFDGNPFEEPFATLFEEYEETHDFKTFRAEVNKIHEARRLLQPARNAASLLAVQREGFGPLPENLRSRIGTALTGKTGTLRQQLSKEKQETKVRLQELMSRIPGAAGVGGRRKMRRTNRKRHSRRRTARRAQ